jgi:hypothetical protein
MSKKPKRINDQESRRRVGELLAHADALSARVLPVTGPVYRVGPNDEPDLVGSAVLVQLGEMRFAFTAAHVLRHVRHGPLMIGVAAGLIPIAGDVTYLHTVGARTEAEDSIDLGIVRLAGESWMTLDGSSFAGWEEFDIGGPIVARQTYGLVGYPASKNRNQIEGDFISAYAYRMIGLECEAKAYDAAARNAEINVMVGFAQKDMWGAEGRRTAPNLYGASGSGLWRFGRRLRAATSAPLLSAIATEWHKRGKHKHILGTRLNVALAGVCDKYDDVRSFVVARLRAA